MTRRSGNGLLLFTNKCAMLSLVVSLLLHLYQRVKERTHDLNLLEFCLPSRGPKRFSARLTAISSRAVLSKAGRLSARGLVRKDRAQ